MRASCGGALTMGHLCTQKKKISKEGNLDRISCGEQNDSFCTEEIIESSGYARTP